MHKPLFLFVITALCANSCISNTYELRFDNPDAKIIFLHRSTGFNVWKGRKFGKKL
jgi:hypothetical protein